MPHAHSRAEYGDVADGGLYEIFQREFGAPGTEAFERARVNFLRSQAGYAVASFLLQAKDRHGGNLMFNKDGFLIHIDFGFILGISPGGNLGFENAAFKLNHEMVQLLDPSSNKASAFYKEFVDLCVRGFLAVRANGCRWMPGATGECLHVSTVMNVAVQSIGAQCLVCQLDHPPVIFGCASQARTISAGIIATVSLMADSGLPCFGYKEPLKSLQQRFHMEMTDVEAARFMRDTVNDAYDKVCIVCRATILFIGFFTVDHRVLRPGAVRAAGHPQVISAGACFGQMPIFRSG